MCMTSDSLVFGCHILQLRSWSLRPEQNFDSSEYKLSQDDFRMLCQKFGPFCLDLFASPFSYLFKLFCSRFLCKDTAAVDTFTIVGAA